MTRGVEGKSVYQPIKVDNNSKAAAGTDQSGAGRGAFGPPGPNVTWVSGVVKKDAETMAKREAFMAQGAMGMHQAVKVTVDSAAQLAAPAVTISEEPSASSEDSVADTVEQAAESSKAVLKAEGKHDDEVAERRMQELKDLHQDLQLSTTGTTPSAA